MMNLFLAVLGIAVGALSGLFGIGGGVLILPSLVFLCGFSQKTATGTTLAMLLPPIGVLAFLEYYKNNYVNVPAAVILVIGFLAGSQVGARYAIAMNEAALKRGFGILLITIGIIYIYQSSR